MVELVEYPESTQEEQLEQLHNQHELALENELLTLSNEQRIKIHMRELDYAEQLAEVDNLLAQGRYGEALYLLQLRGVYNRKHRISEGENFTPQQAKSLEPVRKRLRYAYTGLAFGLLKGGRFHQLIEDLEPLRTEDLLWHASYYTLAVAFRMTRQLKRALWDIEAAIEGYPGQPYYFLELARAWVTIGFNHIEDITKAASWPESEVMRWASRRLTGQVTPVEDGDVIRWATGRLQVAQGNAVAALAGAYGLAAGDQAVVRDIRDIYALLAVTNEHSSVDNTPLVAVGFSPPLVGDRDDNPGHIPQEEVSSDGYPVTSNNPVPHE